MVTIFFGVLIDKISNINCKIKKNKNRFTNFPVSKK